jgi:metal-responsive CopG/Arc/MetJ family transcriptional regulator
VTSRKVAITMPAPLLEQVDQWSAKLAQSRSQFIAEQLATRLQELADEMARQAYDDAYRDEQALAENIALAEAILQATPYTPKDDKW